MTKINGKFWFFIKLFFIFFTVYITCFIYIKYCPIYYNSENNWRWNYLTSVLNKKLDITDSSKKYLFLGESRLNAGIDMLHIDSAWSMAYEGSTAIENFYILKKYLQQYQKPETIFLSISPRFFCDILCFWENAVRNELIENQDFDEIYNASYFLNDTILKDIPQLKFLLYRLKYIPFYQADIYNNRVFFAKNINTQMQTWMQTHRGQREHPDLKDSCDELNYESKMLYFKPSPTIDHYFNKILSLCSEKDIFLFFFAMPMNENSFAALNKDFIEQYKNYMQHYQKKYNNFEISDSLYFYENIFFGDNSHLNEAGKIFFTNNFKHNFIKHQ